MDSKVQKQILSFLYKAEGLKTRLRHSWLSNGRRESVAEHTWRMALMAILLSPYLRAKVNLYKVLKMILIHDLTEVVGMDYVAFKNHPRNKQELERESLNKLTKILPSKLNKEILSLWEEYEASKTREASFTKALDKTEVLIQHIQSDIKTQTKKELRFNLHHGIQYCEYDKFLRSFRKMINNEFLKYYRKNRVPKKLYL